MIDVPAATVEFLENRTKRLATCWRIVRVDGVILRLTTASKTLTVEGFDYTPVGGVDASARRREGAMATHDVEFRGILSADVITTEDLHAKRYDDAEITEMVVDWEYPWAGVLYSAKWWIDKVRFNGEMWVATIEGFSRWLQQKVGDKYVRPCLHKLGDDVCRVDLTTSANRATGVVVDGMLDGEKRRIIRATTASLAGTYVDDWFNWGTVTFTAGANAGLTRDVKNYTQATRDIELQLPFPHAISPGDVFTIVVGCNGLKATCISKFNNLPNHGGFEFIPGTDKVLRVRPG